MASQMDKLAALRHFKFERILTEDPITHALTLLGTLPLAEGDRSPAIVRVEKTAFSPDIPENLLSSILSNIRVIGNTDIYTWLFGWLAGSNERPDVKMDIIHPATEVHIRKYSAQKVMIVRETPDLYDSLVKPFITAFPTSRTQWSTVSIASPLSRLKQYIFRVEDTLQGKSEAEKVLYKDPSQDVGYVLLPDMKWDLTTVSSLYLLAIAFSRSIRSLRDLRKTHLGMLKSIRKEAARVVMDRWGLEQGSLRMFVHYQPSYYHFHVHIVNANYQGLLGMTVGQAHLLDDIISMLELDPDTGPSIFERLTLTYGLGEQHGLFEPMKAAQVE
ncbi:hypothetical protein AcV5_000448 [Taiwanofungus camphoratus]|nr:hypothetical protein AcV5_000448 [Antrodia cinnamomea]